MLVVMRPQRGFHSLALPTLPYIRHRRTYCQRILNRETDCFSSEKKVKNRGADPHLRHRHTHRRRQHGSELIASKDTTPQKKQAKGTSPPSTFRAGAAISRETSGHSHPQVPRTLSPPSPPQVRTPRQLSRTPRAIRRRKTRDTPRAWSPIVPTSNKHLTEPRPPGCRPDHPSARPARPSAAAGR